MKVLGPSEPPVRGEASNRHMLRWLKTVVVSDVEKAHVMCQVGIRKTIIVEVSLPMKWHRNRGFANSPGMSLAGARCFGQAVSGMQVT